MTRSAANLALVLTLAIGSSIWLTPAQAASAAELLEQARGKSRDYEELKAVLTGPDANMRLATFEVMVASGDPAIREVALDVALASTDAVLQALALKSMILSQSAMTLTLETDTSQPQEIQEQAQAMLAAQGNIYSHQIQEGDLDTGVFKLKGGYQGQVSGTRVSFNFSYDRGVLELVDETTVRGPVMLYYRSGYAGFIATWKFR